MTRGEWMDGWSGRKIDSLSRVPGHTQFSSVQRRGVRARQTREHEAALKLRSGEMDPAWYASNTAINFIAGMH